MKPALWSTRNVVFAGILGLLVGGMIAAGASSRWGADLGSAFMSPEGSSLVSGLGGAALGAIIGGLISYLLARQAA
jgi:ABC-type Fe3+ transport system permease subunit